jgi:glucose/arabinose dehydrogenase
MIALSSLLVLLATVGSVGLPPGFEDRPAAAGLVLPTSMSFSPDGRLFVCEQPGILRVIERGLPRAKPFLKVRAVPAGEAGLLGVAFHPDFPRTPLLYAFYTAATPLPINRLSRFRVVDDAADPESEAVLMEIAPNPTLIHNGGALHFGPDGKLYMAVGDHVQLPRAQALDGALGKILRMEPDGTVPLDNPFATFAPVGAGQATFALGLRNPFTFAIEPETGRIYANDTGSDQPFSWEEINEIVPGGNYGWPLEEGPSDNPDFIAPVYAYRRLSELGYGCAISGGTFYRPPSPTFPARYLGSYFFSDYCGSWIARLDPDGGADVFAQATGGLVDLDVGPDGALYYLTHFTGVVRRIAFTGR